MTTNTMNAEVISVFPSKIQISVDDLDDFKIADESLKVGSYLKIKDNENATLMAIIENFSIEVSDVGESKYIIEANPLGLLTNGKFTRGGDNIAIPPKKVEPALEVEINKIYSESIDSEDSFVFSSLSSNPGVEVPVDGNKFFNKHIAVVGSTGSGKSNTIASLLQLATENKNGDFDLNNSHIIIFDIHSEYKAAFPDSNYINIENLILPYWLLNSDELEEILLDTGERDNYNQSSIFRNLVTENKKKHNKDVSKIFYDTPVFFDIHEVLNGIDNLRRETKNSKNPDRYMIKNDSYELDKGSTKENSGLELNFNERINLYFEGRQEFHPTKGSNVSKGDYADGTLDKFAARLQSKIEDPRLSFMFGEETKNISFEQVLEQIMGYQTGNERNTTIIDLSDVPFEVLSITVSLISRKIFEYGYFYKRLRTEENPQEKINNDIPILLVYEEAHKYVPRSELTKYRSSKNSIERIAKEGRKYGVSLLLSSQRPAEISETIFSQCNNFIAMRLTNPNDQSYVEKLLPDTMGNLIDKLPTLSAGEALLVGESIVLPSIVRINRPTLPPSSNDIPYWKLWKEEWKSLDLSALRDEWYK